MGAAGLGDADVHDPDARVPLAAEIALWQTLAKFISEPEFGVRAGGTREIRSYGLLGYVVRFSATLRDALRRVERYSRVFTDAVEFELRDGPPEFCLVRANPALGPGQELAEGYRLAALLRVSREVTGVDLVPVKLEVTYPPPSKTTVHRQYFGCPLHFGARRACMVFHASDLARRLVGADETLAGYLSRYAEHVLSSLVGGETTQDTVRAAIWSLLGDGPPSLERIAAVLGVSPRTLQRRLAAEGTSLHQEKETVRKTMAVAVLRDRSVMIEDVAFLLGYSEPSTFFRSFKRWTGITPRRFRDEAA